MPVLKKEQQKKHFKAIRKAMQFHLRAFCANQKLEDLHKFRLQVKKMQALLLFFPDSPVAEKGAPYFQAIKPIFKHAGRIRGASLNLQRLSQDHLNFPKLKRAEEKILKKETTRFLAKKRAYQKILKRMGRGLVDNFQDIKQKKIVHHYKMQLKTLAREFGKPDLPIESLHENRKAIKRLLYFYAVLPKSIVHKIRLNTEYLDQLQEAIGEWRDGVLFDEWVGDVDHKKSPPKQPESGLGPICALSSGLW